MIHLDEISVGAELGLLLLVVLPVALLAWSFTVLLRGTAPDKHTREADRTFMRFQRRVFRGAIDPRRFRTPPVQVWVLVIVYWMRFVIIVVVSLLSLHLLQRVIGG